MSTIEVPLSKGKFALIDMDDFELVMRYEWKYFLNKGKGYVRSSGRGNKLMHTYIMNCPRSQIVDHKNGNGLDNRRSNLRTCTQPQNSYNRKKPISGNNKYKGVSKVWNRWKATIGYNAKHIYIGSFATAREAAEAYNKKAKELFGEFHNPNVFEQPKSLTSTYGQAI